VISVWVPIVVVKAEGVVVRRVGEDDVNLVMWQLALLIVGFETVRRRVRNGV
jgi:Trk K+ transport system NAD-binding subunit